jgi:PPP family 3-phenylpropionic acid transporter
MNGSPITARRDVLLRFIALYAALFGAFGLSSPFLPAFLVERGLGAEQLGVVLAATTAARLVSGAIAGRLADRFHFLRTELAVCAVLAVGATLLYLAAHGFWTIMAISLLQVVALAPLVPLADALSLAHARPRPDRQAFEYGWVRGAGSAAFVAGTLAAGQAASSYGLSAIIWLSAALLVVPFAAGLVPAFPAQAASPPAEIVHRPWLTLFRQRAFACVVVVAALVLGSHAMYDSFAVIRWTQTGISPAATGVLWSESVAAEVLVFFVLGPRLLRALSPVGALAVAAFCGVVRWGVLAQTIDVVALGLTQPLHGFTFALLHLAAMRIIADTVPRDLAATAQAAYSLVAVGGATAVLLLLSGWLYAHFGAAGFWGMAALCLAAFPVIWLLQRVLAPAACPREAHSIC